MEIKKRVGKIPDELKKNLKEKFGCKGLRVSLLVEEQYDPYSGGTNSAGTYSRIEIGYIVTSREQKEAMVDQERRTQICDVETIFIGTGPAYFERRHPRRFPLSPTAVWGCVDHSDIPGPKYFSSCPGSDLNARSFAIEHARKEHGA